MKLAAIYARSTKDRSDVSIEAQLRELREVIIKDGYAIYKEFTEDSPVSAKSDDRPAFQDMISAAKLKPRPFERVYIYDTSRFSRNREQAVA